MKLDLHIHTIYSHDSLLRPEVLIKIARKRNLDGIAVTDHDTVKGGLRTKALAPSGFLVIPGAEIKTEMGEIIGLFIEEEIKSRLFYEVIYEITGQGGICILPHPYRNNYQNPEKLIDGVDALEVMNARTPRYLNEKARRLAESHSKPKVGGSDAHHGFEIGRVYTCIPGNELTDRNDIFSHGVEIRGSEFPRYLNMISVCTGKIIRQGRRILNGSDKRFT
ncbi:MAG: PHP domain protein [Methanoregula sp. PtaU1.Bin006]|uniref:PHP domain-containing protein n=1 Tax=Methanoregula sp. PtaU1.Bin006 TaxID=1811681 RepID=UPI0009D0A64D|nr:PHP domain-containing protein [Methanoregula sp. PtaU1.Bin006]OPY37234.1 MAG: PHP domain protein [Methanoregula sp. PtaU1.Bin006]